MGTKNKLGLVELVAPRGTEKVPSVQARQQHLNISHELGQLSLSQMSDRSNVTWEFDPASLGLGSCVCACVASVNPTDDGVKIWPPLLANAATARFTLFLLSPTFCNVFLFLYRCVPDSRWNWYHHVLDLDVAGVLAV